MPSFSEGLPITLLEALTLKVPVVASSVGEIPVLLEEGVGFLLKNIGDYREIAESVSSVLVNINALGDSLNYGYSKVVDYFSASMMSKKYTDQYKRLLRIYSLNKVDV